MAFGTFAHIYVHIFSPCTWKSSLQLGSFTACIHGRVCRAQRLARSDYHLTKRMFHAEWMDTSFNACSPKKIWFLLRSMYLYGLFYPEQKWLSCKLDTCSSKSASWRHWFLSWDLRKISVIREPQSGKYHVINMSMITKKVLIIIVRWKSDSDSIGKFLSRESLNVFRTQKPANIEWNVQVNTPNQNVEESNAASEVSTYKEK